MSLSPINAVCTSCKHNFTAVPTRSFLGFQKLVCPACSKTVLYPLTSGYRGVYWVIFIIMAFTILGAFAQGGIGYPGGLGIAVAIALFKDWNIRSRIKSLSGEAMPGSGGQPDGRPQSPPR